MGPDHQPAQVDLLWGELEACFVALGALPPAIEMPNRWTEAEETIWRALVARLTDEAA